MYLSRYLSRNLVIAGNPDFEGSPPIHLICLYGETIDTTALGRRLLGSCEVKSGDWRLASFVLTSMGGKGVVEMFDPPSQRYPKKWRDMSLDFKLMFVYHGCMMALFLTGFRFTVRQETTLTGLLVTVLVAVSLRHRRIRNWQRPSLRFRDVAGALFAAAAITFFLFSATSMFPPSDHQALPWYFAGLGIGGFGILTSLRVVDASEAEFLSHCRIVDQSGREIEAAPPESGAYEPPWKKAARGIYTVAFLLVWTLGVASFFFFGTAFRHGSPEQTAAQTVPLTDHGKTAFVTPSEKRRVDYMQLASGAGIPIVLIAGFILHFVVGVKLFPNAPTISEYLTERALKSNPPPPKPL